MNGSILGICAHGCGPAILGFLLKRTALAEPYVLALGAVVAGLTVAMVRAQPSRAKLRRGFTGLCIAYLCIVAALGAIRFKAYQAVTEEDHLIEWLSAHFLLAGGLVGLISARVQARRRQPSPLTLVLSATCLLACARELEWGQPFFGDKIWYSRNLMRLRAYLDPGYFDEFRQAFRIERADLYSTHLVISAIFLSAALLVGAYVFRQREALLREYRPLLRGPVGRYFLLGAAIYVGAQLLGHCFEAAMRLGPLLEWRRAHDVGHRIVDEPLELLGAISLWISMLAIWHRRTRSDQRPAASEPD